MTTGSPELVTLVEASGDPADSGARLATGRSPAVDLRIAALRRFAVAISLLTILGHLVLGFEQSWAHVLVALATAYATEISLELIDRLALGRRSRLGSSAVELMDFLLPAHITALAIAMLLYPGERLAPTLFAVVVAISSKWIARAPIGSRTTHFLNPSNTGIAVTLLCFPSVGIAPPYQFTAEVGGVWDWLVPVFVVCSGTFLNARFTGRIPLIAAWLGAFALQAGMRHLLLDAPLRAALAPMTGMAFLLFTFYMVSDPGTTPRGTRGQVVFGAAVAVVYSLLMIAHVVFGLFFALVIVCAIRGVVLHAAARRAVQ